MQKNTERSNAQAIDGLIVKDSVTAILPKNKGKFKNAGICTKRKCIAGIERRLPPIRKPTSKEEEIWAVKSLPTDWSPISKPSKIIENLLNKRQNEHEAVINNIKAKFETINFDVEAHIRLKSEGIKRDFFELKNETEKHIKTLEVNDETMLTLGKEDFEKIHDKILQLHQQHINKIEQFYTFLKDLEKLRANKFKEVLRNAYARLHKISYQLPYEIQQYFEHEILRINQIILNNLRCYADLQLQLNLQAENNNRLQMQSYEALRTKWRNIKKKDALIRLNEQQLIQSDREALLLNTEHGKTASKLFLAKEHNMEAIWAKLSPLPITLKDVDTWSRNMQETVTGLDNCARKLINVYKIAIVQVFNGYFEELQQLTENMLEMGLVDTAEISVLSLDVCKPSIQYATRQYSNDLDSLETLWESIITNLQQKLQTTYIFLNNAAHLWDLHFERLGEAKRIVLKDLQNVIQKNNKATQVLNMFPNLKSLTC